MFRERFEFFDEVRLVCVSTGVCEVSEVRRSVRPQCSQRMLEANEADELFRCEPDVFHEYSFERPDGHV